MDIQRSHLLPWFLQDVQAVADEFMKRIGLNPTLVLWGGTAHDQLLQDAQIQLCTLDIPQL